MSYQSSLTSAMMNYGRIIHSTHSVNWLRNCILCVIHKFPSTWVLLWAWTWVSCYGWHFPCSNKNQYPIERRPQCDKTWTLYTSISMYLWISRLCITIDSRVFHYDILIEFRTSWSDFLSSRNSLRAVPYVNSQLWFDKADWYEQWCTQQYTDNPSLILVLFHMYKNLPRINYIYFIRSTISYN